MKKTKDVFISYKRVDGSEKASELFRELTELGYSVFLDTEILQNGKYENAIHQRIDDSTDFIVIVTKSFADDSAVQWIKKELDWAIKSDSNIIPIYYAKPESVAESVAELNEYNGINAAALTIEEVVSGLAGNLLNSNQDLAYKEDKSKDEFTNIKDYMHRHTTRAFMELAIGSAQDGEINDSNYSLALLAQESDYDVISCMWILVYKCMQILSDFPETEDIKFETVKSFMSLVEDTLGKCAILIDEGKLDSANRYFPDLRSLLEKLIQVIKDGHMD